MKATISEVPQPKPPRVVTLEMTEDEAQVLWDITCTTVGVPDAVKRFRGTEQGPVLHFLYAAKDALTRAGVAG